MTQPERDKGDSAEMPMALGYHAAVFLDILNQKEQLSRLTELPGTEADRERFIASLKETYGVVHQYRAAFDTYLKQAGAAREDLRKLSSEAYEQFRRANEIQLKQTGFSDSFVCYAPLMETGERVPVLSVLHLMYAASGVFLAGLVDRCPCRGGLDVGIGAIFPDIELYGPVLYKCYDLESKTAGYPRVVLGSEFLRYIESHAQMPGRSPRERLRQQVAQTCTQLVYVDTDGAPCLDYLGRPIRDLMDPQQLDLETAIEFAVSELGRFREEGNYILAERYHKLAAYLSTRKAELWTLDI